MVIVEEFGVCEGDREIEVSGNYFTLSNCTIYLLL